MKKTIYTIAAAAALVGCVRDDSPLPEPESPRKHNVELRMSLAAELPGDAHTEPMSRVDASVRMTRLSNAYRYIILKEINEDWFVERSGEALFAVGKGEYATLYPVSSGGFDPLKLELRPGRYRIVAVGNSPWVEWNNALVEGTPVKRKNGSPAVPWLFQYQRQQEPRPNIGYPILNNEIFTGTAEFSVEKTGDLHSNPAVTPVEVHLTRTNSWLRMLLRDDPSIPDGLKFNMTTAHIWRFAMESQDEEGFPYGLDAWGDAWYPIPARKTLDIYISSGYEAFTGKDGINYLMALPNATYFFPMIIIDPERTGGHRYTVPEVFVEGQAGHLGYYYEPAPTVRTMRPNTYHGMVLEATEQVEPTGDDGVERVIMREATGPYSDPADVFDDYFEWNHE